MKFEQTQGADADDQGETGVTFSHRIMKVRQESGVRETKLDAAKITISFQPARSEYLGILRNAHSAGWTRI